MSRLIFNGSVRDRCRSLTGLMHCSAQAWWRHHTGRPLVPQWSWQFEAANCFIRGQFRHALSLPDPQRARAYFDSLYGVVGQPRVEVKPAPPGGPNGDWFVPAVVRREVTLLYLHGGGYAFYAAVTRHFIAMLAEALSVRIFAPNYRLTPEHPHPAQLLDGLAAYRHLLEQGVASQHLAVAGDSAGGHLALMLASELRREDLPQPAMFAALSPWTDVGRRGASQFGNDRYDMVQGDMTLTFARWLKGDGGYSDAQLSPTQQNYRGVAPLYLQAGGREILVDRIRDFARLAAEQGAAVRLDVWPQMTHEFQAYGDTLPESRQALQRLGMALDWAVAGGGSFRAEACTEVDTLGGRVVGQVAEALP